MRLGPELLSDFSELTTTPPGQAITSVTTGGIYTPTPSADILAGFDLTVGWGGANTNIDDANSFTTTSAYGSVFKNIGILPLTRYKLVSAISVSSGAYYIQYGSSPFVTVSESDGTYYFSTNADTTGVINIGAVVSGAVVDITTLTLQSLGPATGPQVIAGVTPVVDGSADPLPIGHCETIMLGEWTNETNSILTDPDFDPSEMSVDMTDGYMIPVDFTNQTSSDTSVLGPQCDAGNSSALITTGTLTLGTVYFVVTTELNNFGVGVVQYEYFTSAGTETCDASNTVYEVAETYAMWFKAGGATLTESGVLTDGLTYKTVLPVTSYVAGAINISLGGIALTSRTADGTYTEQSPSGGTDFILNGTSLFEGQITSSISTKEILGESAMLDPVELEAVKLDRVVLRPVKVG